MSIKFEGTITETFSDDLCGYAAEAAAQVLLENWTAALKHGADIRSLVKDVDFVCEALQQFKATVLEIGVSQVD